MKNASLPGWHRSTASRSSRIDETIELGRKMIEFRADLTAAAIRAAIKAR